MVWDLALFFCHHGHRDAKLAVHFALDTAVVAHWRWPYQSFDSYLHCCISCCCPCLDCCVWVAGDCQGWRSAFRWMVDLTQIASQGPVLAEVAWIVEELAPVALVGLVVQWGVLRTLEQVQQAELVQIVAVAVAVVAVEVVGVGAVLGSVQRMRRSGLFDLQVRTLGAMERPVVGTDSAS